MINRIEWLAGRRWAQDVVMTSGSILKLQGGHEMLLKTLRLGLVQKPESYTAGVREIITIVEDALHVQALGKVAA